MNKPTDHAKQLHQKITKGFKIYGALLWAIFLVFTILIPSMNGVADEDVKALASRSFVYLLGAFFLPYFITWKLFERKHGRIEPDTHQKHD